MPVLSHEPLNVDSNAADTMDEDAVAEVLESLDGWVMKNPVGVPRVEKVYSFADFKAALAFTLRVGELAESAGHHPSILTEWGKVTVGWWSHSLGGIHRNDLIMASRTDGVLLDGRE